MQNMMNEFLEAVSSTPLDGNLGNGESFRLNETAGSIYEHFDVNEMQTIHEIQDVIDGTDELKIDNWAQLTVEQKGEVLQNLENQIARIESRKPLQLIVEEMPAGRSGVTNALENTIRINSLDVEDNSLAGLRDIVDTVVHEGRHAYQFQNVYVQRTEANDAKFNGWLSNYQTGYLTQDMFGYDAYRAQPLEDDAWHFADKIVSTLSFR